ncbi:MAG: acyltransferase [Chryseolinea sp.]
MKLKYIESFDGLRGIAIVMLMLFHGSYGYFAGGIPRVDLFSIMSGFLITYLLFYEYKNTGSISFKTFYSGRALRLLPGLFVCLILANALWSFTPLPPQSDRTITNLASLFYFSNLLYDYQLGNLPHLWSLSVEEHFYIIWPLLSILLLFKLSDRGRIIFLCVNIVLLEVFRVFAFINENNWHWGRFRIDPYGFTLCRIDCMLIGALLFFVLYRPRFNYANLQPSRYDNLFLIVLTLIFVSTGIFVRFTDKLWLGGGFIFTNIICACIVLITLRNPTHPILAHRWIKWLGVRSYGIYLYHMPIFYALETFRRPHDINNLVVVTFFRFALSIGFAALSYQYLELPFLKLKNRRKKNQIVPPLGKPFEVESDSKSMVVQRMAMPNGTMRTDAATRTPGHLPNKLTLPGD